MAKNKNIAEFDATPGGNETATHYSEFKRVIRIFLGRPLPVIGLIFIVLLIFTAIFAPWLAPYDPDDMDIMKKLSSPSKEHLLGTDSVGRDTLSRIIYGTHTSLVVGIGAVGMATIIGQSMGMLAAFFGGWVYTVIMRFADALIAIPMLLKAMIVASILGGGVINVIIALGIGMIGIHCRMMCGQVLSVKQNDYILASRSMGMGDLRMMLSEILPNAFPPLLIVMTVGLGSTILAEASLSFLGMGISPPTPAWGSMINDGYKHLLSLPILSFAPGLAIMMVVFGFNMMGDGLRDALDPRLRGAF